LHCIEQNRLTIPFFLFVPLSLRCASLPQCSQVNLQAECSRTLAKYSALDTLDLFLLIAALLHFLVQYRFSLIASNSTAQWLHRKRL
jgi:hypothetical protein